MLLLLHCMSLDMHSFSAKTISVSKQPTAVKDIYGNHSIHLSRIFLPEFSNSHIQILMFGEDNLWPHSVLCIWLRISFVISVSFVSLVGQMSFYAEDISSCSRYVGDEFLSQGHFVLIVFAICIKSVFDFCMFLCFILLKKILNLFSIENRFYNFWLMCIYVSG